MKVSAEYAEEHFAELMVAADRGEEVEIARAENPVLKLVAVDAGNAAGRMGKRVLGAGRGELRVPSDEEWLHMKKEMEERMNDAPLMNPGGR